MMNSHGSEFQPLRNREHLSGSSCASRVLCERSWNLKGFTGLPHCRNHGRDAFGCCRSGAHGAWPSAAQWLYSQWLRYGFDRNDLGLPLFGAFLVSLAHCNDETRELRFVCLGRGFTGRGCWRYGGHWQRCRGRGQGPGRYRTSSCGRRPRAGLARQCGRRLRRLPGRDR